MLYNYSYGQGFGFGFQTPAYPTLTEWGFDPEVYIATAGLTAVLYTNATAIAARFEGANDLIAATDDQQTGSLDSAVLNQIITNVTTEINGYISTIYPIPLVKIGTVAVIKIKTVDSNGGITAIEVLKPGNYSTAPGASNTPAYLRHDGMFNNPDWWKNCQNGTGAVFTVTYSNAAPYMVSGTPVISTAGTGYEACQILVLTGGKSYVPDKISNAALTLCCYELQRRRLSPQENNLYYQDAKMIKEELLKIGNGELNLDGTYRTFYSPATCWGQRSVLAGANSL